MQCSYYILLLLLNKMKRKKKQIRDSWWYMLISNELKVFPYQRQLFFGTVSVGFCIKPNHCSNEAGDKTFMKTIF